MLKFNFLRRTFLRYALAAQAKHDRPVGRGMAVFIDDYIGNRIIIDGGFDLAEIDCLKKYAFSKIDDKKVCLDIGANIGNHSRFFSDVFEKVISFEPHPRTFHLLSANSYGSNIVVFPFGLSDENAVFSIAEDFSNMGANRIVSESKDVNVQYSVKRLDDIFDSLGINNLDYIKIDVEGHEGSVIRGGKKTIKKYAPIISFEAVHGSVSNGTCSCMDELKNIGYKHFYEMENIRVWSKFKNRMLSNIARTLTRIVLGERFKDFSIKELDKLDDGKVYQAIVATVRPID